MVFDICLSSFSEGGCKTSSHTRWEVKEFCLNLLAALLAITAGCYAELTEYKQGVMLAQRTLVSLSMMESLWSLSSIFYQQALTRCVLPSSPLSVYVPRSSFPMTKCPAVSPLSHCSTISLLSPQCIFGSGAGKAGGN